MVHYTYTEARQVVLLNFCWSTKAVQLQLSSTEPEYVQDRAREVLRLKSVSFNINIDCTEYKSFWRQS